MGSPRPSLPERPVLGVGGVVLRGGRVLLVRRGAPPARGRWTLPGGKVELGESLRAALRREILEETGLRVSPVGLAGVFERIARDRSGRIRYHYAVLDYEARLRGGRLRAGSDAGEARWVPLSELARYRVNPEAVAMIRRAAKGSRPRA